MRMRARPGAASALDPAPLHARWEAATVAAAVLLTVGCTAQPVSSTPAERSLAGKGERDHAWYGCVLPEVGGALSDIATAMAESSPGSPAALGFIAPPAATEGGVATKALADAFFAVTRFATGAGALKVIAYIALPLAAVFAPAEAACQALATSREGNNWPLDNSGAVVFPALTDPEELAALKGNMVAVLDLGFDGSISQHSVELAAELGELERVCTGLWLSNGATVGFVCDQNGEAQTTARVEAYLAESFSPSVTASNVGLDGARRLGFVPLGWGIDYFTGEAWVWLQNDAGHRWLLRISLLERQDLEYDLGSAAKWLDIFRDLFPFGEEVARSHASLSEELSSRIRAWAGETARSEAGRRHFEGILVAAERALPDSHFTASEASALFVLCEEILNLLGDQETRELGPDDVVGTTRARARYIGFWAQAIAGVLSTAGPYRLTYADARALVDLAESALTRAHSAWERGTQKPDGPFMSDWRWDRVATRFEEIARAVRSVDEAAIRANPVPRRWDWSRQPTP